MSTETTLKMPKCCCCSVRTGLLIWIGLSIIANAVGIFRRLSILELVSNGLGLLIGVFGFYAVFAGKRALVKGYGLLITITTVISMGIGLFLVFSPETKKLVEEQVKENLGTSSSRINFDEVWGQVQIAMVAGLCVSLGITLIILYNVYNYYKFLVKKEEAQSKPVIA
jgi:multisubunit Na+/H+ antiporter MnhC subunit